METTSTRRITGAGLKKCNPITRPGRLVAAAIAVTDKDEVFVARMASGLHDPVELGEDLPLDLLALRHDLDRQVDGGGIKKADGWPDPAPDLRLLALRQVCPGLRRG